jgi:hypothetical protein
MTKYPALAIAVFTAAIALEANATGVKPPAPQQPINPGVVLNQPVTLKPTLNLSNYNPSTSYSTSGASNRTNVDSRALASSSVYVESDKRQIPVATATAPALSTSNGTCHGSTSAGAQGASFGFSVGSTWKDDGCDVRYDVQMLDARGEHDEAFERGCDKPEVRAARKRIGKRLCKEDQAGATPQEQKPQEAKPVAVNYWN